MEVYSTECCALAQICTQEDSSIMDLLHAVNTYMSTGSFACNYYVMALTNEKELIKNLEELGFKAVHKFNRRPIYDQRVKCVMYTKRITRTALDRLFKKYNK